MDDFHFGTSKGTGKIHGGGGGKKSLMPNKEKWEREERVEWKQLKSLRLNRDRFYTTLARIKTDDFIARM